MADVTLLPTDRILAATSFALTPGADERAAVADRLGIHGVRKLTFRGEVVPAGARDLKLEGVLGATVVQSCVVTGDPVTTRIDEPVTRLFSPDYQEPEGDEVEMPDDDALEPLTAEIELARIMEEALALALPPWPRSAGAEPVDITVTEPGSTPVTDEDTKPFAGLKNLRDKLSGDTSEE
ncbi:MAG: DUF177 domain-containing protein [Silicimonas sp.]|jgi:uncharacterized metal-binding protein YceD (DUF177 family)|nr:DUF177 domain-containing protein [Silicimonas sp.]